MCKRKFNYLNVDAGRYSLRSLRKLDQEVKRDLSNLVGDLGEINVCVEISDRFEGEYYIQINLDHPSIPSTTILKQITGFGNVIYEINHVSKQTYIINGQCDDSIRSYYLLIANFYQETESTVRDLIDDVFSHVHSKREEDLLYTKKLNQRLGI